MAKNDTKTDAKTEAAEKPAMPATSAPDLSPQLSEKERAELREKVRAEEREKIRAEIREQEAQRVQDQEREKIRAELLREQDEEKRRKGKTRRVRIATFDNEPVTGKVKLVADRLHGALFPGQIVEVPEEHWSAKLDVLVKKGRLAITNDEPTRPLLFETEVEAMAADPKHFERDREELQVLQEQMQQTRERMQQIRMSAQKMGSRR